jgi:hypothetical protein
MLYNLRCMMLRGCDTQKSALEFDLLLGALAKLEPILAAEIEMRLAADIAARGRALYLQHLDKLGLAGLFQVGNQEVLFGGGKQAGVRVRFGEAFVPACT